MTGVINIHKETDYTSHDVVAIVRKLFRQHGTSKVGHTGTLDPDATGVLPICLGRATKFADMLAAADKTYIAEVILGITTNTGDISGEVIQERSVVFNEEAIINAAKSFHVDSRGEYMQVPPMFSAIKIDGKKLYELARAGKEIVRPPRPVVIHDIHVLSFAPSKNTFTIEIKCSKGTYIRTLAEDIGMILGCGATMGALTRTRSGMFEISNAAKLDELKTAADENRLMEYVLALDELLPHQKILLHEEEAVKARNGNAMFLETSDSTVWVCDKKGIIGLFEKDEGKHKVKVMM